MFSTTEDGGVQVDSNVGTVDELKAELATETPAAKPRAGKLTTIANAVVDSAIADRAPADEAETDPAVTDADASKAGQQLTKKKKSLQARIDELSTERHTTAAERDQARAEVSRLQAELDVAKGGKPKDDAAAKLAGGVPIDAEKFPKFDSWLKTAPDDANDLEDWVDARDAWKAAKTEATQAEAKARTEHSERFTPIATSFHERMAPVLKDDPKFYDKVDPRLLNTPAASALPPGQKPTFGNFIVDLAIKSDHPKDMLLWLSDPETIRRLVTLQPDDIIRQFTKQELSIRPADDISTGPSADERDDDEETDADGDKPQRRGSRDVEAATSQASPPIKPVRGSSQQSADQEPGDDASDDEWLRWERRKSKASKARTH